MSESTTAPVTAEGLREPLQIAEPRELVGRLVRQVWVEWAREQDTPKPSWLLPWEDLDDGQREVDMRIGAALFGAGRNAGSAALAGDPGDLPARMAAELRRHTITEPDALVCACGAQTLDWDVHLAEVATSARWEDHAATVARLAHAEDQIAALRDHRTRWELEHRKRTAAEAAIERVKALHSPETSRVPECKGCRTVATYTLYENCKTIAALDAPETTPDAPTEETDRV